MTDVTWKPTPVDLKRGFNLGNRIIHPDLTEQTEAFSDRPGDDSYFLFASRYTQTPIELPNSNSVQIKLPNVSRDKYKISGPEGYEIVKPKYSGFYAFTVQYELLNGSYQDTLVIKKFKNNVEEILAEANVFKPTNFGITVGSFTILEKFDGNDELRLYIINSSISPTLNPKRMLNRCVLDIKLVHRNPRTDAASWKPNDFPTPAYGPFYD